MENVLRGDLQSKVALCECGKLHFTYGPMTLHFDRSEFLAFADSVGKLGALVKQAATVVPSHVPTARVCH